MTERRKVVFATPCLSRPTEPYLAALEACLPAIEAAGWDHSAVFETYNPYISGARAKLLRKALDVKPLDPGGIEPLSRTKSVCVAGDQCRQ